MKEKAKKFQDLIVWQKSHKFVLEIYKLTQNFPKTELYGLTSQIRRAAISIPANIAEGFKRRGNKDKLRFFNISYVNTTELVKQIEEVSKILESYCGSILNTGS